MRYVALIAAAVMLVQPAQAEKAAEVDPRASLGVVQQWIYNYRAKPDYAHMPAAVRVLFHSQTFKEPENAGIYLGFIAGAIGSNPAKAEKLIAGFFPVAPEDEWVIVRAIAYSGLPDWRNVLRRVALRMPARRVMIDAYLAGKLPILSDIPLEETRPGMMDKLKGAFTRNPFAKEEKKVNTTLSFAGSQDLLDTLWGYYFATGSHMPIKRIEEMLPWSKSRDTVDKLTVGSMAKYTLASNAARDQALLGLLKAGSKNQPKEVAPVLTEVIDAAETMETTRLRKAALASLEELKRKGPGYKRDISTWGQIGQGALALGCIAAAATGHVELGLPCVVGGAASGAALSFWEKQQ